MSNPKKSKSFLITFIAILFLLFVVYLLFNNQGKIFDTTGINVGRVFEPLFGTPTDKNTNTPKTITEDPQINIIQNQIRTIEAGENIIEGGLVYGNKVNKNNEPIVYNYNPNLAKFGIIPLGRSNKSMTVGEFGEITTNPSGSGIGGSGGTGGGSNSYVCSDGIDNDIDGKTDKDDPQCHIDGIATNDNSYQPNHYSETIQASVYTAQCSNGINDDKDAGNLIDADDPECHTDGDVNNDDSYNPDHYSESIRAFVYTAQCSNGINDDNKEGEDAKDPECHTDGDVNNDDSYNPDHYSESIGITNFLIPQCSNGKDDDNKEGKDSEDPSCHTDFDATNESSYDPKIPNENRTKTTTECGDGKDNDDNDDIDYKDPDCHWDKNVNNWITYSSGISSEKNVVLPLPGECPSGTTGIPPKCVTTTRGVCPNGEMNYPSCNVGKDGKCLNGANNPNDCNEFTKCDENGADNPPNCTTLNGKCLNNETNPPICKNVKDEEINKCIVVDQNPLVFTPEEKSKLSELLRKFYLIAPTLKTEDDILLVYNEIERYQNLVEEIDEMIGMCTEQKADSEYTGPQTVYGNPWYNYNDRGTYLDPFGTNAPVPTPEPVCWEAKRRENQISASVNNDNTPRVIFSGTTYNDTYLPQHVDDLGNWRTDSDGSGLNNFVHYTAEYFYNKEYLPSLNNEGEKMSLEDYAKDFIKTSYCKRWYPNTIYVEPYKSETITTWYKGMSENPSTATEMSYKCIPPEGEAIKYWGQGGNLQANGLYGWQNFTRTTHSSTPAGCTTPPTPPARVRPVVDKILEEYEKLLNVW